MTEREFLKKIKSLDISFYSIDRYGYSFLSRDKVTMDSYLKKEWVIGGITGGSCWGTEHKPRMAESEPEFECLDTVLEALCPSITFLQYKNVASLIEKRERSEDDYYGNCHNYMVHVIQLQKLYDLLKEKSLI